MPTENVAQRGARGDTDSTDAILSAAAECFRENGYAATSIDDVARSLGATKGMIYHHFRSKTDLFFAVYERGMELNFEAIEPHRSHDGAAHEKLALMGRSHAIALMEHQAFQRVLGQGVAMHQQGSTTAQQRKTLARLIKVRNSYEAEFRNVIEVAAVEDGFALEDASLASKSFLAVLNSTVFWYSPRKADSDAERENIAAQLVTFALRGLGAQVPAFIENDMKTKNGTHS
ncbi:MAG: TetR/AcrR family transcriptional regulator [Ahrensia sp.]|nr:TetR/AcrR family transcriptional regulator [Ahrensia sp.]